LAATDNKIKKMSTKINIPWKWRTPLALLIVCTGLFLATGTGQLLYDNSIVNSYQKQWIHAVIMSLFVIPAIYSLRRFADKKSLDVIGFGNALSAAKYFLLGFIIAAIPSIGSFLIPLAFGWMKIVAVKPNILELLASGMSIAFLFEALPEEIGTRGYIYATLNERLVSWKASLLTIASFVMIPVIVYLISPLIGLKGDFNGQSSGFPVDAVITMVVFGSINQIFRVSAGNVWACIGLHLGLVFLGRVFGPQSFKMIQIEVVDVNAPFNLIGISLFILSAAIILFYPKLRGRKWNWHKINSQ
jgi:uncharacterized protein